jgi:hypothetical protein
MIPVGNGKFFMNPKVGPYGYSDVAEPPMIVESGAIVTKQLFFPVLAPNIDDVLQKGATATACVVDSRMATICAKPQKLYPIFKPQ